MDKKNTNQQINPAILWTGLFISLAAINLLFVYLTGNEVKTARLNIKEIGILNNQQVIINKSSEIIDQYKEEIEIISQVFPNDVTIPEFIKSLEYIIKKSTQEYNFKFNSLTPLPEGEKLFLLMTINMKTDLTKLSQFFQDLMNLPYMTHVTGVSAKSGGGFTGISEYAVGLKVYVQNPFNTK